jgi:glycosyltransferase involved in cell wall biosynthesis
MASQSSKEPGSFRQLRLAVHGFLADGVASSAGAFPVLLAELLARGHQVDLFANPNFIKPPSLERFAGYRYVPLRVDAMERWYERVQGWKSAYASAALGQLAMLAYSREAVRRVEAEHATRRYDLLTWVDTLQLWPSSLPVLSWPQSPPHTEGAALRAPAVARLALAGAGPAHFAAVQLFYAYRELMAKVASTHTDMFLCGSEWSRSEWLRFGVPPERVQALPFPLDLAPFAAIPDPGRTRPNTFLWLGRAVPRKRLDLFLAAFAELRKSEPDVRARIVGNLGGEPVAERLLARYRNEPAISVENPRPRAQVPALLAEVDVLVQPSQSENFGFALAEALAAGRPVVGGPTNGTFEYADDAGFGFDAYEPKAVAEAMRRALHAVRADAGAVARAARSAAQRHFSIASVADRFTAIGEALIDAPPRPQAVRAPRWKRSADS